MTALIDGEQQYEKQYIDGVRKSVDWVHGFPATISFAQGSMF